jgi:hypothetical protein
VPPFCHTDIQASVLETFLGAANISITCKALYLRGRNTAWLCLRTRYLRGMQVLRSSQQCSWEFHSSRYEAASMGNWFLMFWDTAICSSSRVHTSYTWRWEQYAALKHHDPIATDTAS